MLSVVINYRLQKSYVTVVSQRHRVVSLPQQEFLVGLCRLQWIICQKV